MNRSYANLVCKLGVVENFTSDLNITFLPLHLIAVKRLKTDKYNDAGIIMSNNFQHGTYLLYTRTAQLFSAMLYYGYAPQLFLRSTMIPIPKGRKVCSTNADLYRSIAISSILSKILDYVIIDQQANSLATSDYQFGFKSHSSTMLCSTMLIETIQYYDNNGRHVVYALFLDASKAFDRVSYSELFNILLDKKSMSLHCTIAMSYASQSGLLCKVEQQKFN